MSGGGFNLDDYVDVAERVSEFYAKHPTGRITTSVVELSPSLVVMRAEAYREATDALPGGVGHSMLGIPGTTPYTRGSEVENAETSAVGRAIAFLGFAVKKGISSRQDVRNKSQDGGGGSPSTPAARPQRTPVQDPQAVWEGVPVAGQKAPVDALLRQGPNGHAFGFVLMVDRPGRTPQKVQVVMEDPLATAVYTGWQTGVPVHATVWGIGEQVKWAEDKPPYLVVHATRVITPEWTVPATDAKPAPAEEDEEDLNALPW